MINQPCLLGVNPTTKACVITAVNTAENAEEMRQSGLICIPVSREKAAHYFDEVIADIYEVAQ